MGVHWRFRGHIAGLGTAEGTRLVVGHWPSSPFGPFSDVMVERPDGRRILLAPDRRVADFVAATYRFDEVHLVPVQVRRSAAGWRVEAGPLELEIGSGGRAPLGHLLRLVPGPVAESLTWARLVAPVAALVLPGVRTTGSAGGGRVEWYGARDVHRITGARARWDGRDLGGLRRVEPPTRFGFSSTPATPSVVTVTTTVQLPPASTAPRARSPHRSARPARRRSPAAAGAAPGG